MLALLPTIIINSSVGFLLGGWEGNEMQELSPAYQNLLCWSLASIHWSDITDDEATGEIHLLWQRLIEFVLFPLLYIVPILMFPSVFPRRYQYLLRDTAWLTLSWTGPSGPGVVYYLLPASILHLWHSSCLLFSV